MLRQTFFGSINFRELSSTLQYHTLQNQAAPCGITHYFTVLCSTVLCNTSQLHIHEFPKDIEQIRGIVSGPVLNKNEIVDCQAFEISRNHIFRN